MLVFGYSLRDLLGQFVSVLVCYCEKFCVFSRLHFLNESVPCVPVDNGNDNFAAFHGSFHCVLELDGEQFHWSDFVYGDHVETFNGFVDCVGADCFQIF